MQGGNKSEVKCEVQTTRSRAERGESHAPDPDRRMHKIDAIRRAGYLARERWTEAGPRTRITSYVPRKRK